jgi:heptosyltransferase II
MAFAASSGATACMQRTVLRHQVECSPCFLSDCPLDFRCMHAVAPEEAANAILALI